jgi:hypothetical protein
VWLDEMRDIPSRPSSELPHELIVNGNRFDVQDVNGRLAARTYAYSLIASNEDVQMGKYILKYVGKEG